MCQNQTPFILCPAANENDMKFSYEKKSRTSLRLEDLPEFSVLNTDLYLYVSCILHGFYN